MRENKYKHEMIDYQFPIGNLAHEDDQNVFNDNVYEEEHAKQLRPLETQPKYAPINRRHPQDQKQKLTIS